MPPTRHHNDISPPVRLLDKQFHIRHEFELPGRVGQLPTLCLTLKPNFFFPGKRDRHVHLRKWSYEMCAGWADDVARAGRGITCVP